MLGRHGQSKANEANRLSEAGDDSAITPDFCADYENWPLTDTGRHEMSCVRDWLNATFLQGFDSRVCSFYMRAVESAYLCHPDRSSWSRRAMLRERYWGPLVGLSMPILRKKHARTMALLEENPLRDDIPEIESYRAICERIAPELGTLEPVQRKLIITHQEVMLAARLIIEQPTAHQFKRMCYPASPEEKIKNGQLIHYSRRDPYTGELSTEFTWMRMIRPAESRVPLLPWTPINQHLRDREPTRQSA